MSYDFKGKRALVTGASRGIGKEVSKQLLQCGAKVFALARNPSNLAALKTELPEVETLCVDIGNWTELRKMVSNIGEIDFLVNNAGIVQPATFEDVTEEQFDSIYDVNVKPIINISQVVVKMLKEKGKKGSIVNVSSILSTVYYPRSTVYASGKAALDRITQQMAGELAPFGIRVNSVNPTAVDTDMMKNNFKGIEKVNVKKKIPLRDICSAEDVANSILFLLSDKARMITGINLPVDGGHRLT